MPGSIMDFFGLASLCLILAACGGGGSGSAGPGQPQQPAAPPSISVETVTPSFTTDRVAPIPSARLQLTVHNTTTTGLFYFSDYTQRGMARIGLGAPEPTTVPLIISYRPLGTVFNGAYIDKVNLQVCLDQACNQPLQGSPLAITISSTVTGSDPVTGATGPPPDAEATVALPVKSRVALSHDVRDAEYSRSLDRIVMAATYPGNALYVYDVATDTEGSVPLTKRPTSVSISPDGLTAAVGHDHLISIVDLAQVGRANAPAPRQVNVSANVFDVVLDGRGRVHAIPVSRIPDEPDQEVDIHTIDIATGTERLGNFVGRVFGQTYARLSPSGIHMFVGNQFTSDSVIDKWDVTDAAVRWINNASFPMAFSLGCGNVWFNESGSRLYSQCGSIFDAESPHISLPQVGKLALSGPEVTIDHFTIAWMDQFEARHEIALIESNAGWCRAPGSPVVCYPRFALFDSDTLARKALYALAPIDVNGTLHPRRGLFVFYKSDGTSKFLLERVDLISDPGAEFYLDVLE